MTMGSSVADEADGRPDGFDEESELHMAAISMSGNSQEIMDRDLRGEPPQESLLDRVLAWIF
jgi:hypothetical protein